MKNLTDIMDELSPEELQKLLSEDIDTEIGKEQEDRILSLTLEKAGLDRNEEHIKSNGSSDRRTGSRLQRILLLAAAAVLVAGVGAGIFAIRAEAKEYQAAVQFFQDNDLPTEGLTRGEMKEIYRDITTDSFTAEKTGELLKGYMIEQKAETPEELKKVWKYRVRLRESAEKGTETPKSYRLSEQFKTDPELGFEIFDCSILEIYEWGELAHTTVFSDFWANGFTEISDGVIVRGNTYTWDSEQESPAWMMKADADGNIRWTRMLDHHYHTERIYAVLEDADGNLAVFSVGDSRMLTISRFSPEGEEISVTNSSLGSGTYWVSNAAICEDGYRAVIGSFTNSEYARMIRVDHEGGIWGDMNYDAGDMNCVICDTISFSDKVYISAYLVPKNAGAPFDTGHYEVQPILQKVWDGEISAVDIADHIALDNGDMTQEEFDSIKDELTPYLHEYYRGILIVCDPEKGEPQSFYEVPGVLGGSLSINAYGQMEWNTESFSWAMTTLILNSSSIRGECSVYRYTFDTDGTLICGEQTDKIVDYVR